MPRITTQATADRAQRIKQLISQSMPDGITEGEMSDMLKTERRTINNYLREMAAQGVIYKEGRCWYLSEDTELDVIRNQIVNSIDRLFEYLKRRKV